MKLLMCLYCGSELDILNPHDGNYTKKVKCRGCDFTSSEKRDKQPEITIIKRRSSS
jgi:hypothetical protein